MRARIRTLLLAAPAALLLSCLSAPVAERGAASPASDYAANGKAKTVAVFTINDFHGSVEEDPLGKNPGMAKLAQGLDELRAVYPASLFLSSGDNYQGSALSNLTKGKIVSEFFKLVRLDASAVGNHEFDWTDARFADWKADGAFPFLAANVVLAETGATPEWAAPYALYRVGGRLIAVVGLSTPDTPSSTKAELVSRYRFLDPAASARSVVRRLQATVKPDAIIALTHLGSGTNRIDRNQVMSWSADADLDRLSRVAGIDAIVTGHSHQTVAGKLNGVPVVQAANYGRAIGKLVFSFSDDGSKKVSVAVDEIHKVKAELPAQAAAASLLQKYQMELGGSLGERVAMVDGDLSHDPLLANVTPMGAWVCEALRTRFQADMAIMNGGGLRRGFLPGPVAVKDFWELMPFDNTAITGTIKGADLKKVIGHGIDSVGFRPGQFAGATVVYDPAAPVDKRVVSITLADGRQVTDDGVYRFVTNDFIFDGGDNYTMFKPAAISSENTYLPIRDLLVESARTAGTIKAEPFAGLRTK